MKRKKVHLVFETIMSNSNLIYEALLPSRRVWVIRIFHAKKSGWFAYIRSSNGILKFHGEKVLAWGRTPVHALAKLQNVPCLKESESILTLENMYELTYTLPKLVKPRIKRKEFGNGWNGKFLTLNHEHISKHTNLSEEEMLEHNRHISGLCIHGLEVEECPKCASWGSNYSGLREHD